MIHRQMFMVEGKKEGRWPFFCRIAFRISSFQPHSLSKYQV
ncbi:hypothetical protein [Aneurinibacillus migulanus]|nr:hypothetical protein [Aneurinibacillus migulanus]